MLQYLLLTLVVLYLLACLKNLIFPDRSLGIPGPYAFPLIGHFHRVVLNGRDLLGANLLTHEYYGKIVRFKIFNLEVLDTSDPEIIQHILKTNFKNYDKGGLMLDILRPFFGNGIFAVNGREWKHIRNTAKPLFRTDSLKQMIPVFKMESKIVLDKLEAIADTKQSIDMQTLFMAFTLDSFGVIGFGHTIGSLDNPVPFSASFDFCQEELDKYGRVPLRMYLPNPGYKKNMKVIDDFLYKIIEERRKVPREELETKPDLLSKYLCMVDDSGEPYSDVYLRDMLINFFIAGRDTTAILLTWTVYLLSQHPEVEKKVVEEIDRVFEGSEPEFEELDKLEYVKAVLDETLRLYPPVPQNVKMAVEADTLPGGYNIPKGTYVAYKTSTLHRLKRLWGEDALEFKPERWLAPGFRSSIHPYQYIPFHAGPRICLGMKQAFYEAKLMLTLLYQRYRFSVVPGHNVVYKKALTMPTKYGLKMHVHTRK